MDKVGSFILGKFGIFWVFRIFKGVVVCRFYIAMANGGGGG
ncbi:hypothetical protein [Helicobacter saguini]|nr:hypothetical protein [Helicobacter saguini]